MPESDPDLLDSLIERHQGSTADHLERRMRAAHEIKTEEETASQRRLEEMWMREHARQQAIADSQAEKRRQERLLVRYVLFGAAVIILLIVVLAIVLELTRGKPTSESLWPFLLAYV